MNTVNHDEFTQNLVLIMLGVDLHNFTLKDQTEMVKECTEIYGQYVKEYFANHHPEFDVEAINNLNMSDALNHDVTNELAVKMDTAYQSFLKHLEESWDEEQK
jgi:hypothetical protein